MTRNVVVLGDEETFPKQAASGRPITTNYRELRKTAHGRQLLLERGYIVRKRSHKPSTSRFAIGDFVAWDGEGITDQRGKHHYILLANSLGDYIHSANSVQPQGLSTTDCFEFLLDTASRTPKANHVIYGGGYDANKILKDLAYSEQRLRKLWDTSGVFYKNYHIDWVRGKWLRIRDLRTQRAITLYDVISFFQMSFVKTLQSWDIQVEHFDVIEDMKKKRGDFSVDQMPEIIRYCQAELAALVTLMEKFRDNHMAAGLPVLSGLYGPGAIANGLLRRHNIRAHMVTDKEVSEAAKYAYAAGRIERLRYGNFEGRLRIYDIASAYPSAISKLPSLGGGWQQRGKTCRDVVPMSLYHIRLFNHDKYASPLFYRKGLAKHRPIFFPNPKGSDHIETWVWTPEYQILCDLGFDFENIEAYIFKGDKNSRPFAWVEDMYYQRLAWKKQGNPAEKNLKLALNSLYGKFVQQAGYTRAGHIPKYHQLEWGGYITSTTRAQLYRAMHSVDFRGIIGVETDSIILAGDEQPKLKLGEGLGEWGVTEYEGITYVQSGVYWLKTSEGWLDKYSKRRGYLPGTLTREKVLKAWNKNPTGDSAIFELQPWLTVDAEGQSFITLGHCYRPGQTLDNWGDWIRGPKKLSLWKGTKREIVRDKNPALHLLDTVDVTEFCGQSSPYIIEWDEEEGFEDGC